MEYIREGSVLPIPFNIIPTPSLVYESFCAIFGRHKKPKELKFENFSSANVAPKLNGNANMANGNSPNHNHQNGHVKVDIIFMFYVEIKYYSLQVKIL